MFTKLEPTGVNTSAAFSFANIAAGNVLTDHLLYANGAPYTIGGGGGGGFSTVSKSTFTANGSGNTFTLTSTPSNVAYLVVNIDGLVQQSASYTLTGNVVTITGTPNSGEVIEITTYGNGGQPGGSNTQIQFNDANVLGGSSSLTFDSVTSVLSVSGNITSTNANLGNLVTANYFTGTLTTGAQPNITSIGSLSSLTSGLITATSGGIKVGNIQDPTGTNTISLASGAVSMVGNLTIGTSGSGNFTATSANLGSLNIIGTATFASSQDVTVTGTPTGTVNYDLYNGVVFDVTPSANWTANVGNIPTTNNRTTVITFIVNQGVTPYVPNVFQISGVGQTVKWINNIAPTGTASKVDVIAYSLIRSGAGAWTVLGQSATYG